MSIRKPWRGSLRLAAVLGLPWDCDPEPGPHPSASPGGSAPFLQKPILLDVLVQTVEDVVGQTVNPRARVTGGSQGAARFALAL
jgi:hypothetical protein